MKRQFTTTFIKSVRLSGWIQPWIDRVFVAANSFLSGVERPIQSLEILGEKKEERPSVLEQKFFKEFNGRFYVIPAQAGIQNSSYFLDSGSLSLRLIGRNDTEDMQRTSVPGH